MNLFFIVACCHSVIVLSLILNHQHTSLRAVELHVNFQNYQYVNETDQIWEFNIYLNVPECVCVQYKKPEENLVFIRAESPKRNFTLKIIDVPTKAGVLINSCKYTEEGLLWGEHWCGSTFACCCSSFHHPRQEGEGRGGGGGVVLLQKTSGKLLRFDHMLHGFLFCLGVNVYVLQFIPVCFFFSLPQRCLR